MVVDFCIPVMYNTRKYRYGREDMNKLFDLNSPFMQFLSKAADLVILSFWWLICSLPIVTVGPASSALYYVALKLARKEDVRITSCFFKGFKDNFKQGLAYSFLFVILGVVLFLDYILTAGIEGLTGTLCGVSFFVLGVWTLCTMFYTYPLQAQFYNTVRQTLINAMILAARKPLTTIAVFVLNMLPVFVAFASLPFFAMSFPVWVLVAPGLTAFVCSLMFVKIFDPLINPDGKKEEPEEEETE
jgi:uncharacterized membrane protein YesL